MPSPLPSPWVDALFARLGAIYGAAFLRQYDGYSVEAVRATWADELGHLADKPHAIKHALENLPRDFPPNVLQFRALAARCPSSSAQVARTAFTE